MTKGPASREQDQLREDEIVRFQDDTLRSKLAAADKPKATGKRKEPEPGNNTHQITGNDLREELQDAVDWFYRQDYVVATNHPLEPVTETEGSMVAPDMIRISIASGISERRLKMIGEQLPGLASRKSSVAPWATSYILLKNTPAWQYLENILNVVHEARKVELGRTNKFEQPFYDISKWLRICETVIVMTAEQTHDREVLTAIRREVPDFGLSKWAYDEFIADLNYPLFETMMDWEVLLHLTARNLV